MRRFYLRNTSYPFVIRNKNFVMDRNIFVISFACIITMEGEKLCAKIIKLIFKLNYSLP